MPGALAAHLLSYIPSVKSRVPAVAASNLIYEPPVQIEFLLQILAAVSPELGVVHPKE